MYKITIITALGLLPLSLLHAQTKIKDGTVTSTTTPKSGAILDLESNNKALLLPRVAIDTTGTWGLVGTAPTEGGYQIYNTNPNIKGSDLYPARFGGVGTYFWNGTNWVAGVEPWNVLGTLQSATANKQNIYQSGRVLIGFPDSIIGSSFNTVLGQKLNVQDNIGISRVGTSANFVFFRTDGSFKTPLNTAQPTGGAELLLGNLLFEGYSDGRRLASANPSNYGNGRAGVAQIRVTAIGDFSTFAQSAGDMQFQVKGINRGNGNLETRMTLSANGGVGIGLNLKKPQNTLVVDTPINVVTGDHITGEINRSGLRLNNVTNAKFLGTDANGDIVRKDALTSTITRINQASYNLLDTDEIIVSEYSASGNSTIDLGTTYPTGKKLIIINRHAGATSLLNIPIPLNPTNDIGLIRANSYNLAELIHLGNGDWIRTNAKLQ